MPLKGGVVIKWGMLPLVRILFLGVLSGHRALKAVGVRDLYSNPRKWRSIA